MKAMTPNKNTTAVNAYMSTWKTFLPGFAIQRAERRLNPFRPLRVGQALRDGGGHVLPVPGRQRRGDLMRGGLLLFARERRSDIHNRGLLQLGALQALAERGGQVLLGLGRQRGGDL